MFRLKCYRCVPVACLAFHCLLPSSIRAQNTPRPQAVEATCLECIRIRVGLPRVVRGPSLEIADNHFTEIHLPDGRFRGFDANAQTHAIDGIHPWDMGGTARTVLMPGKAGEYDSCGQWLNHAEILGSITFGLIHDETACHYQNNGETHKSMSVAESSDYGLTWKQRGQIITGSDPAVAGRETGDGDCTAVNGEDGFFYAYCDRSGDRALIAARAPVTQPGPGNWKKFYQGNWSQPGLGGSATRLGSGSGVSVARWDSTGQFVFTGWVRGVLGLFLSSDHTTLTELPEPMLPLDSTAKSPTWLDRIMYPVLLDARTGANQLSNAWSLVYAYWPSNEGRDKKYLVFRDVEVSMATQPVAPQVGILLARWYNPALHDRWSTTAPVPGNYISYKLDKQSGYLLTAPSAKPSVELEDCVTQRLGHPDHLLAEKGFCEAHDYQRLRTAGWVYTQIQPETMPLYRCYDAKEQSHFASNQRDCENLGTAERLLGYALER